MIRIRNREEPSQKGMILFQYSYPLFILNDQNIYSIFRKFVFSRLNESY